MRIISGSHKGIRINAPKGLPARPTTDMCKESLFNIIESQVSIQDCKALDLFSGTGNITYEFSSRQAEKVVAVEMDFRSYSFIKSQIIKLGFKDTSIYRKEVLKFLDRETDRYDIIFADPPYNYIFLDDLVNKVLLGDLLEDNGIFILEHSQRADFSDIDYFVEVRKYGQSNLSFFKK